MDIKITTNFSFSNLSKEIPKIINDYVSEFVKDTEKGSKAVIDSNTLPSLSESTIKWRKRQGFPTSPPLKASGKLYNSIKADKDVLEVVQYGKWHNDGKVPTVKRSNTREFIQTTSENKQKIDKKFIKDIHKALKK